MSKQRSVNMEYIEECIGELDFDNIKNPNNKKILSTVERFLNREFGSISNCKSITIADNHTGELYGMQVMPDPIGLDQMAKSIMTNSLDGNTELERNSYSKVTNYVIELDSKLGSQALNLKPEEMVAILLHEIGHIVLDSKLIENIQLSYLEAVSMGRFDETRTASSVVSMTYCLGQLQKAQLTNSIKGMAIEHDADKFAVHSGYGVELSKALSKFSDYYRVSLKEINKCKADKARLDEAKMFAEIASSFDNRKATIQDIIKAEYKTSIFTSTKNFLAKMLNQMSSRRLNESIIADVLNIAPRISKKDIDTIIVEIEMAETYEDKLYLIRKIHNLLYRLEKYNRENPTDRKVSLFTSYQKELNGILKTVMNKKIVDKEYGVFVKAPKGYQG